MRVPHRRRQVALLAALTLLALAGCARSNLARVTGRVVENGVPVQLGPGESIQIRWRPS